MEVDTGASVSVVSEAKLESALGKLNLQHTETVLKTYTGETLPVLGTVEVMVEYKTQKAQLPLIVIQGNGPCLFGRNWLDTICLDWHSLHVVKEIKSPTLERILDRHSRVFRAELGVLKDTTAKIYVDSSARPRFLKARPISYFLREKVDRELQRLQQEGILTPVKFSEWATPIVPVPKADGGIRLCGDYKVTINREARIDPYPLPRIEDLFAVLGKGKVFSKLDLTSAYQQVPLEPESRKLTTINMIRGLFEYTRLPFGVSSAPAIFQRVMDTLLVNIPNVAVYLDDILIAGVDD